ncbi:MAG: FAD-dependent oxidoreductase [Pirellulales bacterium]
MSWADDVDVLVIGGGIHGVGVAQAAAAAGYSVTVLEQREIAGGTSSRSSKLIHGGLRYLEQGAWRLVRECLAERELLLRLAPQLVHRVGFLIPVYEHSRRSPWWIRSGLTAYTVLAGGAAATRYRTIRQSEWGELDGLSTMGLRRVFEYPDAQTDDRRLTRAVLQSACSLGAQLMCPATLVAAELVGDRWVAQVDCGDQRIRRLRSQTLVNAAGPWANLVLARLSPTQPPQPVDNVQGAHIELPGAVERGCYYLEVPKDGRAVFVMPWKGHTLLGTTEHTYHGDPSAVHPLPEEIDYLLDVYRHYFPSRSTEMIDSWAGLRVLPGGGKAFGRSRETRLPVDDERHPRVVSIIGGKLTDYRLTADRVVRRLAPSLPTRTRRALTSELTLQPAD